MFLRMFINLYYIENVRVSMGQKKLYVVICDGCNNLHYHCFKYKIPQIHNDNGICPPPPQKINFISDRPPFSRENVMNYIMACL